MFPVEYKPFPAALAKYNGLPELRHEAVHRPVILWIFQIYHNQTG
jgi:hypothetical protein